LKILHFWLDSCIVNKGEKFELKMACWTHLEGFQVVSSHFWALLCTGLTGRAISRELKLLQLPCFQVVCMHSSRGCIGSGGACMCAGGALCGV
jgi:hypothetical protein